MKGPGIPVQLNHVLEWQVSVLELSTQALLVLLMLMFRGLTYEQGWYGRDIVLAQISDKGG